MKKAIWSIIILLIMIGGGYFFFFYHPLNIIKIGAIFDLTGATSDVGVDYSQGVIHAARWINDNGGINKKKIELIYEDYAYDIGKARKIYERFIQKEKIELIQGWGTGDTEALMSEVNKHSVVYMSASYSAALTDPFYTPYNFFFGTDYSTSLRLAIKFIKETNPNPTKAPRMIFIYPDHPYGIAPIPAGKRMAAELGVEYGQDQFVALNAQTAKSQLEAVKAYKPDWVWLGGTLNSCALIIKEAGEIGLDTKFIINTFGFDETLLQKAGPYANSRAFGVLPCVMWGDKVGGMQDMEAANRKYSPEKEHTIQYVKGWISMMVMAEAIKKAGNKTTGYNVRKALETFKDFNPGDLCAPITYTDRDHRPNTKIKIYKIDSNAYHFVTEIGMSRDSRFIGW